MSNAVFPTLPGLDWNMVWTPTYSTKTQVATSGKEYRAALMSSPVYTVQLVYEFLRAGAARELQTLVNFYLARQGSFDNFLFVHPEEMERTE